MTMKLDVRVSRRCFLASASGATALAFVAPLKLFAEDDGLVQTARRTAEASTVTVQKLRGNLSVLMGAGGNIAVLTGRDGKLLIDTGFAGARPKITSALASISPDPIKHLINTHWHFDHADGNAWLNAEGAAIVAHENTHKRLMSAQRVDDWDFDFSPSPLAAIPTEVFVAEKTLMLNRLTLDMKYYGPAHTDGDISVKFSEADIFHAGDTYWNGIYPFIDYSTGGSIAGMIKAAEANVAAVTDRTIVIPGHGDPVSNRAELSAYRDMLVAIYDNVARLKRAGRSLEETVAAKPSADFDGKWGQFVITPAFFTRLVYQGA